MTEAAQEAQANEQQAIACPDGFTKASVAAWPTVPECVQKDVARRYQELDAGLKKYREHALAFEAVAEFAEKAEASGTTLADALRGFVSMEDLLREDFVAGIKVLCESVGMTPELLVNLLVGGPTVLLADYEAVAAELSQVRGERNQLASELEQARQEIGIFHQTEKFRRSIGGAR